MYNRAAPSETQNMNENNAPAKKNIFKKLKVLPPIVRQI